MSSAMRGCGQLANFGDHVAQVLEGVSVGKSAVAQQRADDRVAASALVGAAEQVVPAAQGNSKLILPVSHSAQRSTIPGTPRTVTGPMFTTVRGAAVRRSSSARSRMLRPRLWSPGGCSIGILLKPDTWVAAGLARGAPRSTFDHRRDPVRQDERMFWAACRRRNPMEKRPSVRDRSSRPPSQIGIPFLIRQCILDQKTRTEVVALLGRLLLQAARHGIDGEVDDDAS
jgi:hypothetical protein